VLSWLSKVASFAATSIFVSICKRYR